MKLWKTTSCILTTIMAALVLLVPSDATAYPTRMHMYYGNKLHQELTDSGDGSAPMIGTPYRVQLSDQDARAILENL